MPECLCLTWTTGMTLPSTRLTLFVEVQRNGGQ